MEKFQLADPNQFPGSFSEEILTDANYALIPPALIEKMAKYDLSIPTGIRIGKRWLRRQDKKLFMGEYVECKDEYGYNIYWREVLNLT